MFASAGDMSVSSRPRGAVRFENSGRVVLVTGGVGGIGGAVADAFLESGASVVVLDVAPAPAAPAKDRLEIHRCDVADENAVNSLVADVVRRRGGIDVLVNNAVIQPVASFVPLHEIPADLWRKMFEVNVTGYALVAKAVVPIMLKQRSGVIVNVASAQAHRTAREVPAYGPAKAANLMQAKQWAVEYARDGIRCVSVSPGAIDTPLVRASLEKQGGEAQLANRHPLGRLGRPDEIAAAILWLSSEGASFVTATDLEVDGGLGGFAAFADPYPLPAPK